MCVREEKKRGNKRRTRFSGEREEQRKDNREKEKKRVGVRGRGLSEKGNKSNNKRGEYVRMNEEEKKKEKKRGCAHIHIHIIHQ